MKADHARGASVQRGRRGDEREPNAKRTEGDGRETKGRRQKTEGDGKELKDTEDTFVNILKGESDQRKSLKILRILYVLHKFYRKNL